MEPPHPPQTTDVSRIHPIEHISHLLSASTTGIGKTLEDLLDSEELTTKVASFQQRTKPLWIGLRPSLSDFLLHLPGALPFGRVLPRLSDMHPCDASPTAVQAL